MHQQDNQEQFSYEDSLKLITQMIGQARERVLSDGFEYMLWGGFVAAAALCQYFLMQTSFTLHWIGWMILMPLGGLITLLHNIKKRRLRQVRLPVRGIYLSALLAFLVSLMIIIFSFEALGYKHGLGMILVLYGIWLFISGRIFKFPPMVWGAVVNWTGSLLIFHLFDYPNTLLTVAVAALLGYLVPGYLLHRNGKEKNY